MINGRQGERLAATVRRSPWEQSDTPGTEPAQMQGLQEGGLTAMLPTARVTVALNHHHTGNLAPRLKTAPAWLPSRLVVQRNPPTLSWDLLDVGDPLADLIICV